MVARYALIALVLLAAPAFAATLPTLIIVPDKSSLSFEAVQNHAPVKGSFTDMSGEIHFSPQDLASSSIEVIIGMRSITSDTDKMAETLKTSDWFDAIAFPKAKFISTSITSLGGNRYQANGQLNAKGSSEPVTLDFTLSEFDAMHGIATGTATVKRTGLHVGWSDTGSIEDAVKISFSVTASTSGK